MQAPTVAILLVAKGKGPRGSLQNGVTGMNCSQCGQEAPAGANACTNCGASLASAAQAPPPGSFAAAPPGAGAAVPVGATTAGGAAGQFAFNLERLSREERIAGGATIILLISLFLPWIHGTSTETINGSVVAHSTSGSISGYTLHGYFWIVFILCLAVIAFLVMKAGFATMPFRLPFPDDQAILVATGISFVLVLLGFLFTGYGFGLSGSGPGYSYHVGVSRSWGAYLSIVMAVLAVAPFAVPVIRGRMNKGAAT
jgi:hypothetical protein